jgi:molybdate transport system regulatory protein
MQRKISRNQGSNTSSKSLKLWLRLDFGGQPVLGGGKVRLMELIGVKGSIAGAGREMGMSYRRAWLLIEDLNARFGAPLVTARTGGEAGGGAALTEKGKAVVEAYRALETATAGAASAKLQALEQFLREN